MKCPRCHVPTKIVYTRTKDNVRERTHACVKCELRFDTVETVTLGTYRYKGTRLRDLNRPPKDPELARRNVRAYYARNAHAIKLSKGLKIPVPHAREAIALTQSLEISIDEAIRIVAARKEPHGAVLDAHPGE